MQPSELPVIEDLASVFLTECPLLDVRAPLEFAEGAVPCAVNLPLMTNEERAAVGTCYKQQGQDAAIRLGHELVSGLTQQQRVAAWAHFAQQHPDGALYCFRGGLRSRISQQCLYDATGIRYPRIQGGYKALRQFALDTLETLPKTLTFCVLSGRTGVGKTRLLKHLTRALDLEGLAQHRGSAFGGYPTPQPTQISFENALAAQLLKQNTVQISTPLIVEDESRTIGSLHVPTALFEQLSTAPLILLTASEQERLELSYQEYVVEQFVLFQALYQEQALHYFEHYLLHSADKIKRRLGGVRYAQVTQLMQQALQQQHKSGELVAHQAWVRYLLTEYYDPMYDYQLSQKQQRVIFRGSVDSVRDYLSAQGV